MGERAADWDSKRCEVLGNVEDMSDEGVKMDCSESLMHEIKLYRGEKCGVYLR